MACSFLWELCPQMCTWCANWPHYTFSFTCQCRGIPCCRRSVNVLRGFVRWAGGSNQPLYRPLYALGLDACLFTGMLNCSEAYLHKLVAAWIIMLLAFPISHVSWLWATSMNEFIWWLWKCNGNSWWRFWCNSLLGILSRLLNTYLHTLSEELMNSVGSMAAGHCHSWWRWSATLWVGLTRLWLHWFLSCLARTDLMVTIKVVLLWSFLCNLTEMLWMCLAAVVCPLNCSCTS